MAKDSQNEQGNSAEEVHGGPFITISREYGCWGFSLGLLLLELLNEGVDPESSWHIYHKEILARLAKESGADIEEMDRQRRGKPRLFADFFRALVGKKRIPSGYEVRKKITEIIRDLARKGNAIIVGQGGAGATHDLPNGMSIRLEAPMEWRVKQIAFRDGLSETKAKLEIQQKERDSEHLRKIYSARFPRKPAFNIVYDCSMFSLSQIAQSVVHLMKLRNLA